VSERRWFNRYKVKALGALAWENHMYKVEILDLSASGARVRGDLSRIKEGEEVYLSIAFKPSIKVQGVVRWSRKTEKGLELGLEFRPIDFKTQQYLHALISQMAMADLSDAYLR